MRRLAVTALAAVAAALLALLAGCRSARSSVAESETAVAVAVRSDSVGSERSVADSSATMLREVDLFDVVIEFPAADSLPGDRPRVVRVGRVSARSASEVSLSRSSSSVDSAAYSVGSSRSHSAAAESESERGPAPWRPLAAVLLVGAALYFVIKHFY